MSFPADFFDGVSARTQQVLVKVVGDSLSFDANGGTLNYRLGDIDIQAKLGKSKRLIDLPDGGRLEAVEIGELEVAMPSKTSAFWRAVHYLENHLGWVIVSLVATVFAGWVFLQYGVPALAKYVADATPPSMEAKLGEQIIWGLDTKYGYFSPSKIDQSRQSSVKATLDHLCLANQNCPSYRLEFRASEVIGANAFALPGGIVVITDGLIKLAKNDTEVVAVLAHELGHVKKRHAFRQSLQGALAGLILAAATGDVSSMASGLPGTLMQMHYTRELETEADDFALKAMIKACLTPKAFADILLRLSNQTVGGEGKDKKGDKKKTRGNAGDPVSDLLSSHPDTLLRIKPFLTAKPDCKG